MVVWSMTSRALEQTIKTVKLSSNCRNSFIAQYAATGRSSRLQMYLVLNKNAEETVCGEMGRRVNEASYRHHSVVREQQGLSRATKMNAFGKSVPVCVCVCAFTLWGREKKMQERYSNRNGQECCSGKTKTMAVHQLWLYINRKPMRQHNY